MNNSIEHITNTDDSKNQYIDLVKTQITEEMLDIKSFVTVINYDIDPLFIDEQWAMLNSRRPDELIPLSLPMLSRLNFSRTSTLITKLQQLFPALSSQNDEYWVTVLMPASVLLQELLQQKRMCVVDIMLNK